MCSVMPTHRQDSTLFTVQHQQEAASAALTDALTAALFSAAATSASASGSAEPFEPPAKRLRTGLPQENADVQPLPGGFGLLRVQGIAEWANGCADPLQQLPHFCFYSCVALCSPLHLMQRFCLKQTLSLSCFKLHCFHVSRQSTAFRQ